MTRVAISGWFAGRAVGSGQYTDALVAALRATARPGDAIDLVMPRSGGGPRTGQAIAKLVFEQRTFPGAAAGADVAHVPYWAPPLRSRTPVVVTVHDLIPLVLPAYRARRAVRAYTDLVVHATRRAAAVIADSEHTAADIRAHLRVDPTAVHVVPLGVDARYRAAGGVDGPGGTGGGTETDDAGEHRGDASAGAAPDLAARLRLPPRYGLYLGGFDARKNVATLLAAWRAVHAATGVPLVIAGAPPAGDDPLFPDPRALARRAGLPAEALRCIGFVGEADKPALLAGAAVFAYPSRYEGFGLPPLEAMACGTPVVVAAATSLPEVVGDTGLRVDPDDVGGWAEALLAVLEDADAAARMRAAGLARASGFTWRRTAERTWAIYRSVAGAGGAA